MELILLKDIEHVGRKGQVVKVREGFARNFLFPQKLAVEADKANQKFVDELKARAAARREKEKAEASKKAEKLQRMKLVIEARSGEQGKLFGSVTSEDIASHLAQKGYVLDKKHVLLKDAIRALGSYSVTVELFPEVKSTIAVEVVSNKS